MSEIANEIINEKKKARPDAFLGAYNCGFLWKEDTERTYHIFLWPSQEASEVGNVKNHIKEWYVTESILYKIIHIIDEKD